MYDGNKHRKSQVLRPRAWTKGSGLAWMNVLLFHTTFYRIVYIIKKKYLVLVQSSCEIEDFVETHLCKLCVTLRLCVL